MKEQEVEEGRCATRRSWLTTAAGVLAAPAWPALAAPRDEAMVVFDPIRTELVMNLVVTCANPQPHNPGGGGASKDGDRDVFFPILGGVFEGPGLRGEVVPGGADFPVRRPDGVYTVDAFYRLRTDDGVAIIIHNQGLVYEPFTKLRLAPQFTAPRGKYEWLNKSLFLATLLLDVPPSMRHAKGPDENDRLIQVHRVV